MKTNRIHRLAALVDGMLQQFEEIPLKNEGSDCCYPSYATSGPSLYISGRKDSKVYDLPKEGTAKIKFRMRSKGVDYRENGEETFRTDIEVQSIEPVNLEALVQGYEFGSGGFQRMRRVEDAITKKLKKAGAQTDVVNRALKPLRAKQEPKFESSMKRSMKRPDFGLRQTVKQRAAADTAAKDQGLEAILARYEFGDRARDNGGRFAPGNDVSADDMADAYVKPKRKKQAALMAGAGVAGVGAALAGKKAAPAISQGVGRLLRGAMG